MRVFSLEGTEEEKRFYPPELSGTQSFMLAKDISGSLSQNFITNNLLSLLLICLRISMY